MGLFRTAAAFGTGALVGFSAGGPLGAIIGGFVGKRLMNWMDEEDDIERRSRSDSEEISYPPSGLEQGCPPPWFNGPGPRP